MIKTLTQFLVLTLAILFLGCTKNRGPIGSESNPIKFFFVPSVDAKIISEKSEVVKEYLEKHTPYKFKTSVPTSYVAVVEAFGTKRADIAALNTFGYIMANEKYGTEAKVTLIRHGEETYRSQIIARADSDINSLKDIDGKKVAYVDPASTSGYLLPAKLFKDNKVEPSETVFAQKHDNVVTMVRQRQVEAGATFHSPIHEGKIQDARRLVLTQFPEIEKEVKIVSLTDPIPNDPIVFRKGLPEEVKTKVANTLIEFVKTDLGKKTLFDLYGANSLVATTDEKYDGVRQMLKTLGKNAVDLIKK